MFTIRLDFSLGRILPNRLWLASRAHASVSPSAADWTPRGETHIQFRRHETVDPILNSCYSGHTRFMITLPSELWSNSFVYSSGHSRRWRSRMEVKIMAVPLFAHCKFNSAVTEHWIVLSVRDFVTIRKTIFTISYEKFSGINRTKLKIDAVKVSHFIRECVARWPLLSPQSLTVTSTWRPRLTAHCPIGERH